MSAGSADEMDEPHPYRAHTPTDLGKVEDYFRDNPYDIGRLGDWTGFEDVLNAGVPQLVNEYGWMWLWRDGRPSKLTVGNYSHYLGPDATPEERRELQAYWLQMETEWIRSERSVAGVLAFCMLTNNYGFTGDWYVGHIKDLETGPAYRWFQHSFAPSAVFIDLPDSRYSRHISPTEPGSKLAVNLVGVNDLPGASSGRLAVRILDSAGNAVFSREQTVSIPALGRCNIPVLLDIPARAGGYLITAEFTPAGKQEPCVSRRYIRVGDSDRYEYCNYVPKTLQ